MHDNGGTLPDWWYTASDTEAEAYTEAGNRADRLATALNSVSDNLYAQLAAQYGGANFYQELTLTFAPELGQQQYIFGRLSGVAYDPFF